MKAMRDDPYTKAPVVYPGGSAGFNERTGQYEHPPHEDLLLTHMPERGPSTLPLGRYNMKRYSEALGKFVY